MPGLLEVLPKRRHFAKVTRMLLSVVGDSEQRERERRQGALSQRAIGAAPDEAVKQFVHLFRRQFHAVLDPPRQEGKKAAGQSTGDRAAAIGLDRASPGYFIEPLFDSAGEVLLS